MDYDLLVRHGRVVDGSGLPSFIADVGVKDGKVAEVGNIEIITHDEDGDARETTIWLVVIDGQGFIRTGDTRWGENIRRNPSDVVLRIEGKEYPLRAELIESEKLRERVTEAFHAKYGWTDSLVHLTRGGRPNIIHMISR